MLNLKRYASSHVISKIWQDGEGHDPRLSEWAEVGKGAYFSQHPIYGYAYKYSLFPARHSFSKDGELNYAKFVAEPETHIGSNIVLFASLVCLGNVADLGPGCKSCASPAWDAWVNELPKLPNPTRPPAIALSADAAWKQHALDLAQVKTEPRYDSVMSTEGDLGTHRDSENVDKNGIKLTDIIHPRLKANAAEWSKQFVLFENFSSYPLFILTLTKKRDSPMRVPQLLKTGCSASRIKSLGFSTLQLKDAGCTARGPGCQNLRWHRPRESSTCHHSAHCR